jgi:hypothetical protein
MRQASTRFIGLLRFRWPAGLQRPCWLGIEHKELQRLWRRLQPLTTSKMPLDFPPPRTNRFGAPLVLSRVHWVRPELVVEVKYLTWTEDDLLRQVVYGGLREDKPAAEVRRPVPRQKPTASTQPADRSRRTRPRLTVLHVGTAAVEFQDRCLKPLGHPSKLLIASAFSFAQLQSKKAPLLPELLPNVLGGRPRSSF